MEQLGKRHDFELIQCSKITTVQIPSVLFRGQVTSQHQKRNLAQPDFSDMLKAGRASKEINCLNPFLCFTQKTILTLCQQYITFDLCYNSCCQKCQLSIGQIYITLRLRNCSSWDAETSLYFRGVPNTSLMFSTSRYRTYTAPSSRWNCSAFLNLFCKAICKLVV